MRSLRHRACAHRRQAFVLPALAALLALSAPLALAAASGAPERTRPGASGEPSDAELERLWKRLTQEQKVEVCEWLAEELRWVESFQTRILGYVLRRQERDPGTWPAAEPAPWYDPATHGPEGVIPRRLLPPSNALVKRARERFFARVPTPRLDGAWIYDYGARELRRVADPKDPERIFRNALAGFSPGLDLAEALVEMQLDDGSQQKALAAFGHAYTDRQGRVYGGLTLYDGWASGAEIEMPDIDCLGIVHDVLGDWKTWKAPVRDQRSLYGRIGELFQDARRHRGLRRALAQCYFSGAPVLRDGYESSLDALHALWESASSTPAELAQQLPAAADWRAFLDAWLERCAREPELLAAGENRRAVLEADARAVRAALARVLAAVAASAK